MINADLCYPTQRTLDIFKAGYIQCSDVFKLFCIPIRSCSIFLLQNFGYIQFGYIQSLDIFKPIIQG